MNARTTTLRAADANDPLWYKDAIIYQVHVKAFADSNGDGMGDFPGLTGKLDYLQDLGVTCLWLLPFFPSPLRDDGYDVSDYRSIHPAYGTLEEFRTFLHEAHVRGLRVIIDLVLNHTSDQHPWFQRARRAPKGSVHRDFYVWSDTNQRFNDARIIFRDYEDSNWAWDPVAQAYYWHRFYAHQPDLNYENPEVRRAMRSVVRFWLQHGVDGFRCDAVPYLVEREGTSCENLPETHDVLRELRRWLDSEYSDRVLLAEVNQWPEDVVQYFGAADEIHMCFNFPIMPRLFMAVALEDRFPIVEIVSQTPALPEPCQWATFLRSHDSLTLSRVAEEERDYMLMTYGVDPQTRIHLGIRRRLAPLLHNDRARIELMNALLLALPGTPVLYYGDEIGMGDNVYLGDRDGLRTPMQWSPDRNAGFSRAEPARLYLPLIADPEYGFQAVNVDTQSRNPSSLLTWMRHLIALRRESPAFARGAIEFLSPDNRKVLAFVRSYEDERMLVVANLSRHFQYLQLDLGGFAGLVPVELHGRAKLPAIGAGMFPMTLCRYACHWFRLMLPEQISGEGRS